jgi:pimeloyl-ACP methyl ester carboxylesterase
VVLLHAGVEDRRSWRPVAQRLAGQASVVAYDRRGFGATPPSTTPFSHAEDLLDVLGATADGPAWLAAASMGGGVALDAALLAPAQVAGLVLFSPAVSGSPEPDTIDPRSLDLFVRVEAAIEAGDVDEANRLETWLWLDGPAGPEGRVSGPRRELALAMNAVVLANAVPEEEGASGVDAWARLGEVRAPTTVVCGALDVPFLIDRCRVLAHLIPSARAVSLPGTAHLSSLEQPDVVAALLDGILRDAPA